MGIHRLLHSSCCFLNTNTVTTRQLIGTATTVEAECWQVCGEAWVRGQRKMSQVLGVFGPLDFTMLRAVLAWRSFLNLWTRYFFNIPNFFFGPLPTADTAVHLYIDCVTGLKTRGRIPAGKRHVSLLLYVQTVSAAHPFSYSMFAAVPSCE